MESATFSLIVVPMLTWVAGIILSLVNRWRNPKKYLLTLVACICFLFSYAALFLSLHWLISTILMIVGWIVMFNSIFNAKINPTKNEKPSTKEMLPYLKSAAIGLGTGVIGAAIGFFPILFLHYKLWDLVKNTAIPESLLYVLIGYPMPWIGMIFLPIGGAIFGCIGSLIGLKMRSRRLWLWGTIAGLLFNFFVSFTSP